MTCEFVFLDPTLCRLPCEYYRFHIQETENTAIGHLNSKVLLNKTMLILHTFIFFHYLAKLLLHFRAGTLIRTFSAHCRATNYRPYLLLLMCRNDRNLCLYNTLTTEGTVYSFQLRSATIAPGELLPSGDHLQRGEGLQRSLLLCRPRGLHRHPPRLLHDQPPAADCHLHQLDCRLARRRDRQQEDESPKQNKIIWPIQS